MLSGERDLRVVVDPAQMAAEARTRRPSQRIGFVPTMGFLHEGHVALMHQARPLCDWLVVSIYVNPLQFAPHEDLDRYPRDPDGDLAKCRAAGVDVVFMPTALYRPDHSTRVRVDGVSQGLCGGSRPHFFEGVATVVARLFGVVQPHVAIFGEKDFQQLRVIQRLVDDLAMDVTVLGGPLVRAPDGLALSSRNAYLSPEQRQRATSLFQALRAVQAAARGGLRDVAALLSIANGILDIDALDYLEIRDEAALQPLTVLSPDQPARAFVAAWMGKTRLIDNLAL